MENRNLNQEPYIKKVIHTVEYLYNKDYGDDRICRCGHPYYRHFDSYEKMANVGCKYCECYEFKETTEQKAKNFIEDIHKKVYDFTVTLPDNEKMYFVYNGENLKFKAIPDGGFFENNGQVWEKMGEYDAGCLSDFNNEGMILGNPEFKLLKIIK